ncbi:MAG: RHS repeat domain-containing protein [Planctomycetota bacterium]
MVYYYHFDGLGSVIALSNENKEIIERYSYDVFGEPNRTSDVNNPYLFTGRRYDPEAGLYYYRARYYDYYTGRWLSHDPLGINPGGGQPNRFSIRLQYVDGLSLYQYVRGNPLIHTDAHGLLGLMPSFDLDWDLDLDEECWPTGSVSWSTTWESVSFLEFFGSYEYTLAGSATLGWTDDDEANCKHKWKPWEFETEKHIDLWPPWDAHSDFTVEGSAPDASVSAGMHAEVYTGAWYDAGVSLSGTMSVTADYKEWVAIRCKCMKVSFSTD